MHLALVHLAGRGVGGGAAHTMPSAGLLREEDGSQPRGRHAPSAPQLLTPRGPLLSLAIPTLTGSLDLPRPAHGHVSHRRTPARCPRVGVCPSNLSQGCVLSALDSGSFCDLFIRLEKTNLCHLK